MPPRAELVAQERAEVGRKRQNALRIWNDSVTIVDPLPLAYLRERRGLRAWRNDALKWHPACPWGDRGGTAPCIIAPVSHPDGTIGGVWRIRPVLEGKVDRYGLGKVPGGACRLFPGRGNRLLICEGVEDALAGHMLTGGWPAWAALSAGRMRSLQLPAQYTEVLIFGDNDENGTGQEAATVLGERLQAEGRTVTVAVPEGVKDANDVVLSLGRQTNE
jgi:putative DNA primase/helicase